MKHFLKGFIKGQTFCCRHSRRLYHNDKTNGSSSFMHWCQRELRNMKREGLYREPPATALHKVIPPYVKLASHHRKMLDFSTSDFLHLAYDQHVIMAYNVGLVETSSVTTRRNQHGTPRWAVDLEELIIEQLGTESCLACSNISDAMGMLWTSRLLREATVFYDEYTTFPLPHEHTLIPYRHQDYQDLEIKLQNVDTKVKVIITDSICKETGQKISQSGTNDLIRIAKDRNSFLFVNTSYDWTITSPDITIESPADLIYCDFTKQIGLLKGGFISGRDFFISDINEDDQANITDMSGAVVSAIAWILQTSQERRSQIAMLHRNSRILRRELHQSGFDVKGQDEPIIAIQVPTHNAAKEMVTGMKNDGILCRRSEPEFSQKDKSHVQLHITVNHDDEHLDLAVTSATAVGNRYKII